MSNNENKTKQIGPESNMCWPSQPPTAIIHYNNKCHHCMCIECVFVNVSWLLIVMFDLGARTRLPLPLMLNYSRQFIITPIFTTTPKTTDSIAIDYNHSESSNFSLPSFFYWLLLLLLLCSFSRSLSLCLFNNNKNNNNNIRRRKARKVSFYFCFFWQFYCILCALIQYNRSKICAPW